MHERPKSSISEILGYSRNNSNNELVQTQPFEPQKFDPSALKHIYNSSMVDKEIVDGIL